MIDYKPWVAESRPHNAMESGTRQVKDADGYFVENGIRLKEHWSLAIASTISFLFLLMVEHINLNGDTLSLGKQKLGYVVGKVFLQGYQKNGFKTPSFRRALVGFVCRV
ncbi:MULTISPECIES: type III-B CRISPR module-associated Cmr3 family protein [unclassified Synechocystis]|uniref:type III-B CRISPR module-associated Cmr3 family protein n=1 Tax=unclassified Synechocystis TaxID=2640012 RepID=UPI0004D17BF4|nr:MULTISPECIES: type III-B CRISPR module-associated Cmr3 family protein [unclassified Synechocystis]AIE73563.1 CRISPR-associated RAMP Cmr3 [Synechocystis sp. PCC 6714]